MSYYGNSKHIILGIIKIRRKKSNFVVQSNAIAECTYDFPLFTDQRSRIEWLAKLTYLCNSVAQFACMYINNPFNCKFHFDQLIPQFQSSL